MKMVVKNFEMTIELIQLAMHYAKLLDANQIKLQREYKERVEQKYSRKSKLYKFFFDPDYDKYAFFFSSHDGNVKLLQSLLDRMIPLQAETITNEFVFEDMEVGVLAKYAFIDANKYQELCETERIFWET
jgi:hypothetical protein